MIWNTLTGEAISRNAVHETEIMAMTTDGRQDDDAEGFRCPRIVATGGLDGIVKVWQLNQS